MTEQRESISKGPFRLRAGAISFGFLLCAALLMWLLIRIDVVHYASQRYLYRTTAVLLTCGVPGTIIRPLDLPSRVALWYGLGFGLGLVVFGMSSVGATPMFPLILAAFGVSFWPADKQNRYPAGAVAIGLISGCITCALLWGWDLPLLENAR